MGLGLENLHMEYLKLTETQVLINMENHIHEKNSKE